ncbi:MAG: insulinase family protein, partial [Chloroflexota bacterium]
MTLHGFDLINEREIAELKTTARLYRHARTGAQLLSLANDDENKTFGITFRTPPSDATGVAHILEHGVLNGSRKYPVKEPFTQMVKGSLRTFINAMTFPDKTAYPVASQNLQDFYNLVDVYFDAVFHPLIPPEVLAQEGWHYELTDVNAPLAYKGVVFNEMKGAYSSPDGALYHYSRQSLFPDNAYGVDSGGDPKHIPDLTHEQYVNFHRAYYHPSNALIWFYGDDDPAERLRRTNAVLAEFDARPIHATVALQPRFPSPRRFTFPYDASADDKARGMVAVNWMLDEYYDAESLMTLDILSYLLLGTQASPLRKALIDSGLGEEVAGGGLQSSLRQMTFAAGLKGIDVANADKVEAVIMQTLDALHRDGFDPELVEAALNTVEFWLRENNTGAFPRGLSLMFRALTTWLYDRDPLDLLAFESPLQAVKQRIAAGEPIFTELIRAQLLDNTHRVSVVVIPDPTLRAREDAAERETLDRVRAALSADELNALVVRTRELKKMQETPDSPEALATLPMLKVSDLDQRNKPIP